MQAPPRDSDTEDRPRRQRRPKPQGVSASVERGVVLFGGLAGAPVASMERYAETLRDELPDAGWPTRLVRGRAWLAPGPRPAKVLSLEFSRHVLYPRLARRQRAEVFHVTDHSFGHLVRALPAERTVVTCHDLMPWMVPEIFSRRLGRAVGLPLWERSVRAMTHAGHVACVSECTRQDVIERLHVPEERISVIPNGVSDNFRPLPTRERIAARPGGVPEDAFIVLHVGHGQPYKNVEQVIRVLGCLRDRGVNAVFVKLGPLTEEQEALITERGLNDFVYRRSRLSDPELNALYNAADALLYPSKYEGFGLPVLEAMRAGLPVVTSDAAALIEVSGGLAPAFRPDDVESMADALQDISERRDSRQVLTEAGRRHAMTFTWHRTARMFAAVYDRLAC